MLNNPRKLNKSASALLIALVLAIAAFPAAAAAQTVVTSGSAATSEECGSPTNDQYKDATGQITTCVKASSGGGSLDNTVGPLPFTGFDVIAMAAVALAVTGLGLALQRAVSRQSASRAD